MRRRYEEEWRKDSYHDYDWDNDGFPGEFVYGDHVYVDDYYMEERWKPIKGFEDEYWVSDLARVWSVKTQSFLKIKPMDSHGHLGVCLYSHGKRYYRYIHRLVAEAFIPNPHNYPLVRHLEDIPEYNTVDDLDWGTHRDNFFDSVRNGNAYIPTAMDIEKGCELRRIPIVAINLSTGEETHFRGQTEASRILNIQQANIWKVLNGERKHAGGFTFRYRDDRGARR